MADDDDVPTADNPAAASAVDLPDQRRRRRKKESEAEKGARFWREIFETEIGRREMWAILAAVKWESDDFTVTAVGFPDPNATWFNAGRHSYARHLFMSWLRVAPEGVMKMLSEHDPRFMVAKR